MSRTRRTLKMWILPARNKRKVTDSSRLMNSKTNWLQLIKNSDSLIPSRKDQRIAGHEGFQ
jgi:hypothetical protein